MGLQRPKNLRFWITILLAGGGGVTIAIAEAGGLIQSTVVFKGLGIAGVLYVIAGVLILPYLKLKISDSGFRYTNHLGETYEVQWSRVTEISLFKEYGELEWLIKTKDCGGVFICENELLYRRRLCNGACKHLSGFSLSTLQEAIRSSLDGAWTCFRLASNSTGGE